MRVAVLLLGVLLGLSGCVVYDDDHYDGHRDGYRHWDGEHRHRDWDGRDYRRWDERDPYRERWDGRRERERYGHRDDDQGEDD